MSELTIPATDIRVGDLLEFDGRWRPVMTMLPEGDKTLAMFANGNALVFGPGDTVTVRRNTAARLEHLRGELRAERISYGDLVELQSLAAEIDPSDVELLEAAGVPEHDDDLRARFDAPLRLRIIIDNQDAADAPESPFTLNLFTDDTDGTPSLEPWDLDSGCIVGASIPDMLRTLALRIELGEVTR